MYMYQIISVAHKDEMTAKVSNAFEHEFDGVRTQTVFVPNLRVPLFAEPIGAIVGRPL